MRETRPTLYLQPHYDDVALSCGATAARDAARAAAFIATVFAGEVVDAMVGDFAAWKHRRWGMADPDAVVAARRAEDEAAARALRCPLRWLALPDAIYRGDRYDQDALLYGDLHPEEQALAQHLAEEIVHLPEWSEGLRLCVPLAVGSHVDHQLVFEAGAALARRGVEVWAYEDLPYAIHTPEGVAARLGRLAGRVGDGEAVPVAATLARKLAAIACYASQLPVIFRFTDDFRAAVTGHALRAGQAAGAAERFWRVLR